MAYTVGTAPGQLNAANYVRMLAAPGMTPSTNLAALRQRYPGLSSFNDQELANYASWEDYLGQGPDRNDRINAAWQQILQTNPEYAGAMPGRRGYDANGNVTWGQENYHHDASGKLVQDPWIVRHPGLAVAGLTAAAAGTGGLATGAWGGAAPAATTTATTAGTSGATATGAGTAAAGTAGAVLPSTQIAPTVGSLATGGTSSLAGGGFWGGVGGALGKAGHFLGTPWGQALGKAGSAIFGGIMAKRAADNARKYSPEELAAIANSNKVAGQASDAAAAAIGESKPYLRDAGGYYQTLLHGNRAAMSQAVAPAYAATTDIYRGAERNLQQSGVRGAARDVARGELNRERASKLSGLVTGVQPGAAQALGSLGVEGMRNAAPLYNTAGNMYGNILTAGMRNRQWGDLQGTEAGRAWGGAVGDIFDIFSPKKKQA